MHPPTGKFERLSLATSGMAPVTRSRSQKTGGADNLDAFATPVGSLSIAAASAAAAGLAPTRTDFGPFGGGHGRDSHSSVGSDAEEDEEDDDDDDDEDDDGPVRSPLTNLLYDIDNLDSDRQELVRELFRRPEPEETPSLVIQWCGISNDPDVYAFQLQEVVPRTIRIGSPQSRFPQPVCNCMSEGLGPGADPGGGRPPCRHVVWLMDQVAHQTLHEHPPREPLRLDHQGFPEKLGQGRAYARISDVHIDVLAHALHCGAGPPDGRRPSAQRIREAREILAAVAGVYDEAGVDAYAPDIFDTDGETLRKMLWSSGGRRRRRSMEDVGRRRHRRHHRHRRLRQERCLVERGDLQRTILRMLVANDVFFNLFLRLLAPRDVARDPFRKIQQRVAYVLDEYAKAGGGHEAPRGGHSGAPQPSVAWAANHIQHAVEQVRLLLQQYPPRQRRGSSSSSSWESLSPSWARRSAGRALVWIFQALVFRHNHDAYVGDTQDDRNLYQRLIGNAGASRSRSSNSLDTSLPPLFLLGELALLTDQVELRPALERIRARIETNGYRPVYMRKLDDILAEMKEQAAQQAFRGSSDSSSDDDDGSSSGTEGERDSDNDSNDSDSNSESNRKKEPMAPLVRTGSKRHSSGASIPLDRSAKRVARGGGKR